MTVIGRHARACGWVWVFDELVVDPSVGASAALAGPVDRGAVEDDCGVEAHPAASNPRTTAETANGRMAIRRSGQPCWFPESAARVVPSSGGSARSPADAVACMATVGSVEPSFNSGWEGPHRPPRLYLERAEPVRVR